MFRKTKLALAALTLAVTAHTAAALDMSHLGDGAVIQVIRIESTLTRDGVMEVATDRAHQFREIPGLVQKFYFETGEPNHYGGLYVWESREAMMAFLQSDLAKTMGQAYELTGPPTVELLNVVFQLRE